MEPPLACNAQAKDVHMMLQMSCAETNKFAGKAISGDTVGDRFYYNVSGCECVSECQGLDGCVAFVDNKEAEPPYCAFKSSTDGIYDKSVLKLDGTLHPRPYPFPLFSPPVYDRLNPWHHVKFLSSTTIGIAVIADVPWSHPLHVTHRRRTSI